mmetsp:Transcript_34507/g.46241  ORF Transcript_34507/g.46241 Transcript_34507/m.46241 type:complete len:93 (-) Transcript_34507:91-369(-)
MLLVVEEEDKEYNEAIIQQYFGLDDDRNKNAMPLGSMKQVSNNDLKSHERYKEIRNRTEVYKETFDALNELDIELYDYIEELVTTRRKDGSV